MVPRNVHEPEAWIALRLPIEGTRVSANSSISRGTGRFLVLIQILVCANLIRQPITRCFAFGSGVEEVVNGTGTLSCRRNA